VASTRALVLEAHTSLVFTSFPVARVKTWTPTDGWDEFRPAAEALCSAGATDASTWAIALDASRLRALFPHLALRFDLDDGTQADVTHELAAGRQDVYAWPRAPLDVRTEPLAVEVEDAAWEHGVFRVEVHARPDSLAAPPGRALWSEATAWGRVVLLDYIELIRASSQEPRLELGPLVIGKRYVVTMRDEASGDHARAFFVHDGSVVRLRLAGGVRVHGLLDVTPAEPIDHLERVVWTFGERPGSAYWFAEPQQVPVAADGSFALVLPDPVPFAERAPFPRPDALALEFRAGGFEPRKLAVDTAGRREIDLGAVRLESLPAQFVLAAGHGLEAEHLGDQDVEVADAAAGVTLSYHLAGARLRADGALDVALELGKGGAGFQVRVGKSRDARGWSAPDALVLSIDGEGFPFVRGGDGLLHPEPAREFTLRLETDPSLARDPLRLGVGWEWNGIRHWIRSWAPEAREAPLEASFRAPVHGATLWWVLGDDVGAAHAVGELGEPALVLRVP
jgi:hypothetical protein